MFIVLISLDSAATSRSTFWYLRKLLLQRVQCSDISGYCCYITFNILVSQEIAATACSTFWYLRIVLLHHVQHSDITGNCCYSVFNVLMSQVCVATVCSMFWYHRKLPLQHVQHSDMSKNWCYSMLYVLIFLQCGRALDDIYSRPIRCHFMFCILIFPASAHTKQWASLDYIIMTHMWLWRCRCRLISLQVVSDTWAVG